MSEGTINKTSMPDVPRLQEQIERLLRLFDKLEGRVKDLEFKMVRVIANANNGPSGSRMV